MILLLKIVATAVVYRQRPSSEDNAMINLGRNVDIYLTSNNSTDE